MERAFLVASGALGAAAVGLGAYGAHGLEDLLAGGPDVARRLEWWSTATEYQLPHAVVLAVCAWLASRYPGSTALRVAGVGFVLGVLLFCGTLYAMSLGAPRWFGAITPLGGLSLIVGWLALVAVGLRAGRQGGQ